MLEWINNNSAAVQAGSAVAIAILTLVLIIVTLHYTGLTKRMAQVSERALEAQLRPYPEIAVSWEHKGRRDGISLEILATVSTKHAPAYLHDLTIDLFNPIDEHPGISKFATCDFPIMTGRIVYPGPENKKKYRSTYHFDKPIKQSEDIHSVKEWKATLKYGDTLGLKKYEYVFWREQVVIIDDQDTGASEDASKWWKFERGHDWRD